MKVTTKAQILANIAAKTPSVLDYSQISILPTREDFIDKKMATAIAGRLKKREPVCFMPNDVVEPPAFVKDYFIHIYGVLLCGTKVCVKLTNIPIYVDVCIQEPTVGSTGTTLEKIKSIIAANDVAIKSAQVIDMMPLHAFHEKPVQYVRVFLYSITGRKKTIEHLGSLNYKLATDDTSKYFNVIARTHSFKTAGWNRLQNYTVAQGKKCQVISLDVDQYTSWKATPGAAINVYMEKDRTLIKAWDIETCNHGVETGEVPKPTDTTFDAFMINSSYFWHTDEAPMIDLCAVCAPTVPKHGCVTVICKNEIEVVSAYVIMTGKMNPEYSIAYNNGSFDWPVVLEKMKRYDLLGLLVENCFMESSRSDTPENVYKWKFGKVDVKISAERTHFMRNVPTIPGTIDIDMMPCMMQLYPRSEVGRAKSLNHFLQINKMPSKEDMPYTTMFKIYRESIGVSSRSPEELAQLMGDVAHYCTIDCHRPYQLMMKRGILGDKRELANLSFTPLFSAFYHADMGRVCNMVGHFCSKVKKTHGYEIAFTNKQLHKKDYEKDHFPGGYVFPPQCRLHNDYPITGIDFASLYPSLMMCYNISPDMIVTRAARAQELEAKGYTLHRIEPFDYEQGEEKNKPENKKLSIDGWCVRHDDTIATAKNKAAGVVLPPLPGVRMGIFPSIVKKLFDKRVPIKKEFLRLEYIIDALNNEGKDAIETTVNGLTRVYSIDELHFYKNKVNSKQYAIKILANTFYGVCGQYRSPMYSLLVAGGITTAGQRNIKFVAAEVERLGFSVKYGDTDSLYITCPLSLYEAPDAKYKPLIAAEMDFEARVKLRTEYWSELVELTIKHMGWLTAHVKQHLSNDNGTSYLRMAYEEVCFPTLLCGKKKYVACPHREIPNFVKFDPMIKGIEIIKQGQAQISKTLGEAFIMEVISPRNERGILDICIDYIHRIYQIERDPVMFKKTAAYKPNKENIPVKTFIARMRAEHEAKKLAGIECKFELPEPGDKFDYIMVKRETTWSITGKRDEIKNGQKMLFLSEYDPDIHTIDLEYYISGALIGIFARFISSEPQFQSTDASLSYKKRDEYSIKKAQKHLEAICEKISGIDRKALKATGQAYRSIYKQTQKTIPAIAAPNDIVPRAPGNTKKLLAALLEELSIYDLAEVFAMKNKYERACLEAELAAANKRLEVASNVLRTSVDAQRAKTEAYILAIRTGKPCVAPVLTDGDTQAQATYAQCREQVQFYVDNLAALSALTLEVEVAKRNTIKDGTCVIDPLNMSKKDATSSPIIEPYQWM